MSIAASPSLPIPALGGAPRLKPARTPQHTSGRLAGKRSPVRKWPFPPAPVPVPQSRTGSDEGLRDLSSLAEKPLSRREQLTDVLLVLAWGAIIPGLMWLGSAAGF